MSNSTYPPSQPDNRYDPRYPDPAVDDVASSAQVGNGYIENRQNTFVDADGNLVQRHEEVYEDTYQRRTNVLNRVSNIIYFVVGMLSILLLMRFVFRLIGSDPTNGLVNFIYNFSAPFVAPFTGIAGDPAVTRGSVFEFTTLIAIALYVLLAWGIVSLLNVLFEPSQSSRQTSVTTRRRRF